MQRELAQRLVTDIVAPQDFSAQMYETGAQMAEVGLQIKQKIDVAKMNDFAADANIQLMKVTNDWRVANEGDPFNEKALEDLHSQYRGVFSQYDDKIGLLSRGQWQQLSQKMMKQQQSENLVWGTARSVKNAENNINSSIKKNLAMAQELGKSGDMEKADQMMADTLAGLQEFGTGVLGSETFNKLTEDYKSDYMKSFLVGKAQTDPDGALEILSREGVAEKIGSAENTTLIKNLAIKQKKLIEKQKMTQMLDNEIETLAGIANGSIDDIAGVTYLASQGIIRPRVAEAYVGYITDPDAVNLNNDKGFSDYVDQVMQTGDKALLNDLLVDIMEKKDINQDKLAAVIKVASIRSKGLTLGEYREKELQDLKDKRKGKESKKPSGTPDVDALYNSLMSWAKDIDLSTVNTAVLTEQWINEIANAQDYSSRKSATDKVKEDMQVRINPNKSKYKVDDVVNAPNGKAYKVVGYDSDGEPLVEMVR